NFSSSATFVKMPTSPKKLKRNRVSAMSNTQTLLGTTVSDVEVFLGLEGVVTGLPWCDTSRTLELLDFSRLNLEKNLLFRLEPPEQRRFRLAALSFQFAGEYRDAASTTLIRDQNEAQNP